MLELTVVLFQFVDFPFKLTDFFSLFFQFTKLRFNSESQFVFFFQEQVVSFLEIRLSLFKMFLLLFFKKLSSFEGLVGLGGFVLGFEELGFEISDLAQQLHFLFLCSLGEVLVLSLFEFE